MGSSLFALGDVETPQPRTLPAKNCLFLNPWKKEELNQEDSALHWTQLVSVISAWQIAEKCGRSSTGK